MPYISRAYRIPTKDKNRPRPLILQFVSELDRDRILWSRKMLKDPETPRKDMIYVNELLSKQVANLFSEPKSIGTKGQKLLIFILCYNYKITNTKAIRIQAVINAAVRLVKRVKLVLSHYNCDARSASVSPARQARELQNSPSCVQMP